MKYYCTVKVSSSLNKREKFAAQEIENRLKNMIVDHDAPIAVVKTILDGIATRANLQYQSRYKIRVFNPIGLMNDSYAIFVMSCDNIYHRDVAEVKMTPHQRRSERSRR